MDLSTNDDCQVLNAISATVDMAGTVSMHVIINGFSDNFTNAQVVTDCEFIAINNNLCIDIADLRARIETKKHFKMFTHWGRSTFAICAKLVKAVNFRCAPQTGTPYEEFPSVMWREGGPHSIGLQAYTNLYLIVAVTNGPEFKKNKQQYDPLVAAVFRAAVMTEAEMGFFRLLVIQHMEKLSLSKAAYTVLPHCTCFRTAPYSPTPTSRQRSNLKENIVLIAVQDNGEGRRAAALIREYLNVRNAENMTMVVERILGGFNCLIHPDLELMRVNPSVGPTEHIWDDLPVVAVSGLRNNLSGQAILTKLWAVGRLRVSAITSVYISRGHKNPNPPTFVILPDDILYIAGEELFPKDFQAASPALDDISKERGSIRITAFAGKALRDASRKANESAHTAWLAGRLRDQARLTNGPMFQGTVAVIPPPPPQVQGGNSEIAVQLATMQAMVEMSDARHREQLAAMEERRRLDWIEMEERRRHDAAQFEDRMARAEEERDRKALVIATALKTTEEAQEVLRDQAEQRRRKEVTEMESRRRQEVVEQEARQARIEEDRLRRELESAQAQKKAEEEHAAQRLKIEDERDRREMATASELRQAEDARRAMDEEGRKKRRAEDRQWNIDAQLSATRDSENLAASMAENNKLLATYTTNTVVAAAKSSNVEDALLALIAGMKEDRDEKKAQGRAKQEAEATAKAEAEEAAAAAATEAAALLRPRRGTKVIN